MIDVSISGDQAIILDFKDRPQSVTKALVRAMNRSMASGRTIMVREIAGDTKLKSKDVRDAMPLSEATLSRPEARLSASLKKIPLIRFQARGPEPSRGKGRGVTYRLGAGSRERIPNAFIATMKSGHRGVFKRVTSKRLPLIQLYGPSLGRVFEKFRAAGLARTLEAFEKNFDHELQFERSNRA
jgi:hypothetical protein